MTDSRPLAYRHTRGSGPTILFLPGYASDMTGAKALAIEAWARETGRAFLRFDYAGCGESPGVFKEQTLAGWVDDALAMIDDAIEGPVVPVGSSMGGWIALLAARARPERIAGLVGIAPAPDFTDWGFTQAEKMALLTEGRIERASPYADTPTVFTRAFWSSGEANRVMHSELPIDVAVRLVQGQRDADVPWERTVHLASRLRSADVQTILVKDGDHRLSRESDIALILRAIEDVLT